MTPSISVVIPTRNRPDTVARLLLRIKQQAYTDFECLVIDDGSGDDTLAKYGEIWKTLDDRFRLHLKGQNERGGGPGKTRNTGIRQARGTFIAFCDDDDMWIKDDHLACSAAALTKYDADLFFGNMQLSNNGKIINPNWFSTAPDYIWKTPVAGETDIFQVTPKDVGRFLVHRTLHANTLVVARELILRSGMYYEREIFGEDYDINFRLVDNAKKIIFRSTVVAELNVSDHSSFIRSYQEQERTLLTILAALRAETQVADAGLRRVARSNRAWFMLDLARPMLDEGQRKQPLELAVQSLLIHPSAEALRLIGKALLGR
jgi:glycosyltransferase involved in cell wall biosynthesis